MKLVLGGAQLGQNYGLKIKKKIPFNEIKSISSLCKKKNVRHIDTALSYKNSHKTIGNTDLKNLKIITKLKLPQEKKNIENWLDVKFEKILLELKTKKIESVIIHDYRDIIGEKGKIFLSFLRNLKKKNNKKNWHIYLRN